MNDSPYRIALVHIDAGQKYYLSFRDVMTGQKGAHVEIGDEDGPMEVARRLRELAHSIEKTFIRIPTTKAKL